METACLRQTEIPHTSRLFSDFQYHFDRLAGFYRYSPTDPTSYEKAAQAIQYPEERRAKLVKALRARNGDSAALDRLARPDTLAVVTGQQVGLFSGPSYTVYKALTAIHLSEQLNAQGIPAVPIFWLATEDHDFAEVNHSFVFDGGHQHVALRVNGTSGANQRPVGLISVVDPPVAALREALAAFPFANEVVAMVEHAYRPGTTFGAAFQNLLKHVLGDRGLLFIDPLDPLIRELAAPLLRDAVLQGASLNRELLERNKALESAGYHAQVHVEPQTSLVFLLEGDRRITLRRQNGDYAAKERRFTTSELADLAEHLSPNALLRPVVQDYLLPTVAYVGGPAELAYIAQSRVIYDDLLGRMPVAVARGGFTLLDARTSKLMERYGLSLTAFFHGEEGLREFIARKLVPPELVCEFEQVRGATASSLDHLKHDITAFDPTLAAALEKSRAKILHQLSKMEQKTARETLRRNERAAADAQYMAGLVFPEKHLQERYYSILPFIAKHGPGLIDTLYEHVSLDCPDHKVLVV